jgi:peroxisomal membrane protein 2
MAPPSSPKASRNPLLLAYLAQLSQHPLRTKALTTGVCLRSTSFLCPSVRDLTEILPKGTLCFLQEVLGSHLASVPVRKPAKDAPLYTHALARAKVDARAFKMALYGFVVSAPLSHVLVGELQKAFAGRTGRAARIGQVIASNLIVSPVQAFCKFQGGYICACGFGLRVGCSLADLLLLTRCVVSFLLVYLASLAVIGGAKSWDEVKKTVKGGFFPVIRVCFRPLRCIGLY